MIVYSTMAKMTLHAEEVHPQFYHQCCTSQFSPYRVTAIVCSIMLLRGTKLSRPIL